MEADAFFLQKELVADPMDCEVEQWYLGTRMQDDFKKSLAAVVNEQRLEFAKSADTITEAHGNSTRVSPSLSSSQELLAKSKTAGGGGPLKGGNVSKPAAVVPQRLSNSNTVNNTNINKFVGGFCAVKGQVATDLMGPADGKGGKAEHDGDERSMASDDTDNNSESTKEIIVPQFASINSGGDPVRKNSDDASGESDRTFVEPYLTSAHTTPLVVVSSSSAAATSNESTFSSSLPFASLSRGLSTDPVDSDERDALCKSLNNEALLSRSSFREKNDEVDRTRARREDSRKKQLSGRTTPTPVLPSAVGKKGDKGGVSSGAKKVVGHHFRAAYEEPPMWRQHGSQLRNEKMFQSVLADAVHDGANMRAMFSTSPSSNRFGGLANFTGSRPNSRGAKDTTDSKNAHIKHKITEIIRTNAQFASDNAQFASVVLPVGHGRGVTNRNTLRNTHTSPHANLLSGVSPLEALLNEARRMSSPLQLSPHTAFDDRSMSSSDSHRSHSSHYSSASGVSLQQGIAAKSLQASNGSPHDRFYITLTENLTHQPTSPLPARKSALSMSMDTAAAADPAAKQPQPISEPLPVSPAGFSMQLINPDDFVSQRQAHLQAQTAGTTVDVQSAEAEALEESSQIRSPSILIAAASEPGVTKEIPAMRQQSGSAPAQISSIHECITGRSQSKEWTEEEEDELRGIF